MTSSVPSLGVFGATHTVRLLSFQKNSNIFLFLPQCAPRQGKNTSSQLRGGHHTGHLLGIELLSWLVSYCVVLPSVICSLPQLLHGHPGGHNHNSAVLSLLYQVRWGNPFNAWRRGPRGLKADILASVEFHSVFSVVPNLERVGGGVLLTSGDPLKPGFPEKSSVHIVPSLLFHLEFSYSNNIR